MQYCDHRIYGMIWRRGHSTERDGWVSLAVVVADKRHHSTKRQAKHNNGYFYSTSLGKKHVFFIET